MVEYMFTYYRYGAQERPIIRLMSENEEETVYQIGTSQSVIVDSDTNVTYYKFVVGDRIKTEVDVLGRHYAWYFINNVEHWVDPSKGLLKQLEVAQANIDYLSMMSGIDIPTEDPTTVQNE